MRIRHIKGAEEYVAASPFVVHDPAALKDKWKKEVFMTDAPLYMEIGIGMGRFIRQNSFTYPDKSFIGLELNSTVLYKAIKRYENELALRGLDIDKTEGKNLRFIRSDARFLAEYFGMNEIDKIYLNFSDPWPKDKNANKRLTSPQFLNLYRTILKDDGDIEFKTDNRGLFDYSMESFPSSGWEITSFTYDLHNDSAMNDGNIMTEYEAKFSEKGNPIFKLIASKK